MTGDINQAIDQLADRLGVAADKIVDVVPHYASMKAATGAIGIIVMMAFAVLATVVFAVYFRRYRSLSEFDRLHDSGLYIAICSATVAATLAVVSAIVLCDVISWSLWPDAKVAELIVSKL